MAGHHDSMGYGHALAEATVKLTAGVQRVVATGEGNGPVNALDHTLRKALAGANPELDKQLRPSAPVGADS